MKSTDIILVARANKSCGVMCLTANKFYVVCGEYVDLINGEPTIVLYNNIKQEVNLGKRHFNSFQKMTYAKMKTLNRPIEKKKRESLRRIGMPTTKKGWEQLDKECNEDEDLHK